MINAKLVVNNIMHLMTGPKGSSEFCFQRPSTFESSRNKTYCFPRRKSFCCTFQLKNRRKNKIISLTPACLSLKFKSLSLKVRMFVLPIGKRTWVGSRNNVNHHMTVSQGLGTTEFKNLKQFPICQNSENRWKQTRGI